MIALCHPSRSKRANIEYNCNYNKVKEKELPDEGVLSLSKHPAGRRLFEAQGRIPPSAEGGLRNFLKKVP
jgi:hypothetical protein